MAYVTMLFVNDPEMCHFNCTIMLSLQWKVSHIFIFKFHNLLYNRTARDFDDTMWSAPESPSVVRSIFSTVEMTDSEKSFENDKVYNTFLLYCIYSDE